MKLKDKIFVVLLVLVLDAGALAINFRMVSQAASVRIGKFVGIQLGEEDVTLEFMQYLQAQGKVFKKGIKLANHPGGVSAPQSKK